MATVFYRRLQLLCLTILLIVAWGISALISLPRLEDPALTPRVAIISTSFAGASARRVESVVTSKLEDELSEVGEISLIASTSEAGSSSISVELKQTVRNVDEVWTRIRDRVANLSVLFPEGVSEPEVEVMRVKGNALIAGLIWERESPPNYAILNRLAEDLQDRLRFVPGTERTEMFGAPSEEIVVEPNPVELAALGLTAQQLSQQIEASDAKVSAGQLRNARSSLLLEVAGELTDVERVRNISINLSGTKQTIRLGDLAQVSKGTAEPTEISIVEGKPAIVVAAEIESNWRIDRWSKQAQVELQEFKQKLPDGTTLVPILEQSRYVSGRLNALFWNLCLGVFLVAGATLAMMGWRSAIGVTAALPLSILMVLGCMQLMGLSLHQISIVGTIIALGLLIDNAIIVVDEVQAQLREGHPPEQAVTRTVKLLTVPLLSSTFTTVLAFTPIAFSPGDIGEFIGSIGMTVILSLLSSLLLSLTILPALAARLSDWFGLSGNPEHWWESGLSPNGITALYRYTLQKTFTKPLMGIALGVVIPVLGFIAAPQLQVQFFPPSGRDQLYVEMQFPVQTALRETEVNVLAARERMLELDEVEAVHGFIGNRGPQFYYNVLGGFEQPSSFAQLLVQLNRGRSSTPQLVQSLQAELDNQFPTAQVLVRPLEQGPPFSAPIEVSISGPNLEELRNLGDRIRTLLAQTPGITHTLAELSEGSPKLVLNLDEEQIQQAGLDKTEIAQQLDALLEGSTGGSIMEATEELTVRVRLPEIERSNLGQLASLNLDSSLVGEERRSVPLSAIGSFDLVPDISSISHLNGRRVNEIQAFVAAGTLPNTVFDRFRKTLRNSDFLLPEGYELEFGGEQKARGTATGTLLSNVGIVGLLMTLTLVLSFNSFWLAGTIAAVALCSVGLGLGVLIISGYPFGFTAILGILGLTGLAINDSIVVISALQQGKCAANPNQVLEIVLRNSRHIIATTLTTMVGFIPLLFDPTGFWPPLAVCVVGGVGGATILAIYFVPSFYLLLQTEA